jgi:hypothetical protein
MFCLPFYRHIANTTPFAFKKAVGDSCRKRQVLLMAGRLALTGSLLTAAVSHGQTTCPVVVLAANPSAVSAISGTALSITFRNASSATTSSIVFAARFGLSRKPMTLTERAPLDPGKTGVDQWGDNRLLALLHISKTVTVWPQMVLFADGSNWVDDGTEQCAFRSDGSNDDVPLGVDSQASIYSPAGRQATPPNAISSQPAVGGGSSNREVRLTANQKIALINGGKASLLTVRTYPSQATITVDGKVVGTSPLSFVLLKTAVPRDIYITMPGYAIFYRAIDPNGSTIQVAATLVPLSTNR